MKPPRHIAIAAWIRVHAKGEGIEIPGLRLDRGALRFIDALEAALTPVLAEDVSVIVTVTAPIRKRARTAVAAQERVQHLLESKSPPAELDETIHGNQVRARMLKTGAAKKGRVIGLVHNPEGDIDGLFRLAQSLIRTFD